jgi:transposase InsO family protein
MFQYLCITPSHEQGSGVVSKDMAYTTNPKLPKIRRDAVRLVKYRGWSTRKAARYLGYHQSTIVRWCKKDMTGGWREIPTESSRPKTSPCALSREIVEVIIEKRSGRRRCGQIIHQELLREGISVSLSSVQRILERCHLLKKRSPWKRPHDYTERPKATHAGALLQIDTIHIIAPDGDRIYVYTIIDLFSRWAYAEAVPKIGARESVLFIERARRASPFSFDMIQSDHGSEFSTWFTHHCRRLKMAHRHGRVGKKNDQAHVERFNRTIQEECLDKTAHTLKAFRRALRTYMPYYNNERLHMGIQYQTPREVMQRC